MGSNGCFERMYKLMVNNDELNTNSLLNCGFSPDDLDDLINNEVLKKNKNGSYSFVSSDNLFLYGKNLESTSKHDIAISCFKMCYKIDSQYKNFYLQLFYQTVKNRDYDEAFSYFDIIYDSKNPEMNLYLFLLNMLINLPDKYKKIVKALNLSDITINPNDERFFDINFENKIREKIFAQKFIVAAKKMNSLAKNTDFGIENLIICELLNRVTGYHLNTNNIIMDSIESEDYEKIINLLENESKKYELDMRKKYTLVLAKKLHNIVKTGNIPISDGVETHNLFNAINHNRFDIALEVANEKNNVYNETNPVYLLLCKINDYINDNNKSDITNDNSIKENVSSSFVDIFNCLMQQDLDKAFDSLKYYLKYTDNEKYEFLLVNLIKASYLDKDFSFKNPMLVLTKLQKNEFEFDLSSYIQLFYESLEQNKFEVSRVYLDIISNSSCLTNINISTTDLEKSLSAIESHNNLNVVEHNNNNNNNKVVSIPNNIEIIDNNIETTESLKFSSVNKQKNNSIPKYDDSNFIKRKQKSLQENKGIILLKSMDSDRSNHIHSIVSEIEDMDSFSIGSGRYKRVVLRYCVEIEDEINWKEIVEEAKKDFKRRDYDSCIEKYLYLLSFGNPKAYVYGGIGLAYMNKSDIDKALMYLTVATELNKVEKSNQNYTELIGYLSGEIPLEDKKPYVNMELEDFNDYIDEYYNIDNAKEMIILIDEFGLSIDEVGEQFNLDNETKNVLSLVMAKKCYSLEKYNLGDKYLKRVERAKDKTKFTKSLFAEVTKNKRFYKNRNYNTEKSTIKTKINK